MNILIILPNTPQIYALLEIQIRKEHSPLKGTGWIPQVRHNFSAQNRTQEQTGGIDLKDIWGGYLALSFH